MSAKQKRANPGEPSSPAGEPTNQEEAKKKSSQIPPGSYIHSDLGNAQRLQTEWGHQIIHCPDLGWFTYTAGRWTSGAHHVKRLAQDTIRAATKEIVLYPSEDTKSKFAKFRLRSENDANVSAALRSAETLDGIATEANDLDKHPYLLNVANGTVDLRSGKLLPFDPTQLLTQRIGLPYLSDAKAPRWEKFLDEVFSGNEDLVSFVHRAVGYSATGEISEQVLFFCHGDGANGKSTFIDALLFVLGEYAGMTAPGLLMMKRFDPHPTELADLWRRRLVVTSEASEEKRLDEEKVKHLTGGDPIKARTMRKDFFEFMPTHKFWLTSNYLPIIRGTDTGIWRRQRLIPFNVIFRDPGSDRVVGEPTKDLLLPAKLRAEAEGILAWIVRGAVEWYVTGLRAPEAVTKASREYQEEMDLVGQFIVEACISDKNNEDLKGLSSSIYDAYEEWCHKSGESRALKSRNGFGRDLTKRGFPMDGKTHRKFIRALTVDEQPVRLR